MKSWGCKKPRYYAKLVQNTRPWRLRKLRATLVLCRKTFESIWTHEWVQGQETLACNRSKTTPVASWKDLFESIKTPTPKKTNTAKHYKRICCWVLSSWEVNTSERIPRLVFSRGFGSEMFSTERVNICAHQRVGGSNDLNAAAKNWKHLLWVAALTAKLSHYVKSWAERLLMQAFDELKSAWTRVFGLEQTDSKTTVSNGDHF